MALVDITEDMSAEQLEEAYRYVEILVYWTVHSNQYEKQFGLIVDYNVGDELFEIAPMEKTTQGWMNTNEAPNDEWRRRRDQFVVFGPVN